MEAAEDGETFFVNVAVGEGEESTMMRKKFSSLWKSVRGGWKGKRPKRTCEVILTVSVMKKNTSCGRKGEADWP
jgi:hypothetical protein